MIRYGKLCLLLVVQIYIHTFLPNNVYFECRSHHARIICFFEKESLEFFSMDCHIFLFLRVCVWNTKGVSIVDPLLSMRIIYIYISSPEQTRTITCY